MVAGGEAGGSAVLFYLIAYAMMTLGAFAVVIAIGRRGQPNENLDDYAGVGFRSPFLGLAMIVFMLSLAGIPPLGGFIGKFYIFSAAIKSGYVGLAVIGVLNSVISVYYYVGVLVRMYMTEGGAEVAHPAAVRTCSRRCCSPSPARWCWASFRRGSSKWRGKRSWRWGSVLMLRSE